MSRYWRTRQWSTSTKTLHACLYMRVCLQGKEIKFMTTWLFYNLLASAFASTLGRIELLPAAESD